MFAKVKNRKRLVLYTVLAVALIAAEATYAWFVLYLPDNVSTMGELDVECSFLIDDEEYHYDPGLEIEPMGTVKNTGSTPFITKSILTADSTLVRDADGKLLTGGQTILRPEDSNI